MSKLNLALLVFVIAAAALVLAGCTGDHAAVDANASGHMHERDAAKASAESQDSDIAEQRDAYPLDTCVVMGGKLGNHGAVIEHVHEGRLVRFCCKGCIATFQKDPQKYLKKLDAANAA